MNFTECMYFGLFLDTFSLFKFAHFSMMSSISILPVDFNKLKITGSDVGVKLLSNLIVSY